MRGRTVRRTGGRRLLLIGCLLAAALPACLSAQVVPNRSTFYLHPTDVIDARAVWLNPAGLAVRQLATLHVELSVEDPGARGRLRQITAGFSSRGFGGSYQRDALDSGLVNHTYRVGIAGSSSSLAAGLVGAHYRGALRGTGWDIGMMFRPAAWITLGGTVANIGEPGEGSAKLAATMSAGITVAPLGPRLAFSAHARATRRSTTGYALGGRWGPPIGVPLTLLARLDTDRELRRVAFAFGLSAGIRDVAGAVVSTGADLRTANVASLYGVIARQLDR